MVLQLGKTHIPLVSPLSWHILQHEELERVTVGIAL